MGITNWSEIQPPNTIVSNYTHTRLESPLGCFLIEWKGWKQNCCDYTIQLNLEWITCVNSLEEAKEFVTKYVQNKITELNKFLYTHEDTV